MREMSYYRIGLKYNSSLKRRVIEYQVINSPIAGTFMLFREECKGHPYLGGKWIDITGPTGKYVDHFDFAKAQIDRHESRRPYSRLEELFLSEGLISSLQ